MASLAVETAFKTRLATWSHASVFPLAPLNENAASPAQKYMELDFPVATEDRMSIGQPALFRETGTARFTLYVLVNDGIDSVAAYVEELRTLFRDQDFDGVLTFEATPPVYDKNNRDGAFYAVPFHVVYQYDLEQ